MNSNDEYRMSLQEQLLAYDTRRSAAIELQHFVVTYGAQQTQSVSLETMNHML